MLVKRKIAAIFVAIVFVCFSKFQAWICLVFINARDRILKKLKGLSRLNKKKGKSKVLSPTL